MTLRIAYLLEQGAAKDLRKPRTVGGGDAWLAGATSNNPGRIARLAQRSAERCKHKGLSASSVFSGCPSGFPGSPGIISSRPLGLHCELYTALLEVPPGDSTN